MVTYILEANLYFTFICKKLLSDRAYKSAHQRDFNNIKLDLTCGSLWFDDNVTMSPHVKSCSWVSDQQYVILFYIRFQ